MKNETGMLKFVHDIQVGHRLFTQPGKCQQIHGHSMEVELQLIVGFNVNGYAINDEGMDLEFGAVKKIFRDYLDVYYDHKLLLNKDDPWAQALYTQGDMTTVDSEYYESHKSKSTTLPGLIKFDGDPSTENIAKHIAMVMAEELRCTVYVTVQETGTNAVLRHAHPSPRQANIEAPSSWIGA
jgi:6-pyruvoyl-tetrahydropterin synthase